MGIGRREFVTGLAAVAVAGVVPAQPASAAFRAAPTGIVYNGVTDWRSFDWELLLLEIEKYDGATWHYQAFDDGFSSVLRHLPTGFTFVADGHGFDDLSNVELLESNASSLPSPCPLLLGYQARSLAYAACRWGRDAFQSPHDERAIYLWHMAAEQPGSPRKLTYCAAPPLLADGFSRKDIRVYL